MPATFVGDVTELAAAAFAFLLIIAIVGPIIASLHGRG